MKKSPETTLSKEIIASHNHLGKSAIQWLDLFLDDCLASFGLKLKEGWPKDTNEHLFSLGRTYSQEIIKRPFEDVLGEVYQTLASQYGKKALGQYFTPSPVAQMMATIGYSQKEFDENSVVRFYEPCLGSGVMALAFMHTVYENDPHFMSKLSVTGIDLDIMCVKMGTLQILGNNLIHELGLGEIKVLQGNSLDDPINLETFYHASTLDYMAAEAEAVSSEVTKIIEPAISSSSIRKTDQIDLF